MIQSLPLWRLVGLSSAFLILILFSFQYPASTSFPMGGDSQTHIAVAQKISNVFSNPREALHGIRETWYPASAVTLSLFRVLPFRWSDRYIWWMSTGYVAVGLSMAWLLYRLAGWQAAAWAMALWALTPISINTHFEDGTGAQLWSLCWLLFFIERTLSKSTWGSLFFFVLALLSHPLTGLISILVLLCTLPVHWFFPEESSVGMHRMALILSTGCLLGGAYLLLFRSSQILPDFAQVYPTYLTDLLRSPFGPAVIAALPGWLFLYHRHRSSNLAYAVFTSLIISILFLAFNDQLGFSVWTNRFKTYVIVLIVLGASSILPETFQTIFQNKLTRLTAITTLMLSLYLATWQTNIKVYAYYESQPHYSHHSAK